MDMREAETLIQTHLQGWRRRNWGELVALLDRPQCAELVGATGVRYQVEVMVSWDGAVGGTIRVIGCIDNGGLRALAPLSRDFLLAPDGRFLRE